MPKPNYSYEKRQRELRKSQQKEEKRQKKLERRQEQADTDGNQEKSP